MLSEAAFGDAIARERRSGASAVLDLLGEYGVEGTRGLIRRLDARLRAAGAPRRCCRRRAAGPELLAPLREAAAAAARGARGRRSRAGRHRPAAARAHRGAAGRGRTATASCWRSRRPRGEEASQVGRPPGRRPGRGARAARARGGPRVAALLERYRDAYRARKEAEIALDFDDLQERACELLAREDVGAAVRERFDLVLVDEFQDTNGLQCRLLDALVGPGSHRVFVGDAWQSIYRFRYADVELFRARGERAAAAPAADRQLPLAARAAGRDRARLRAALRRARLPAAARAAHRSAARGAGRRAAPDRRRRGPARRRGAGDRGDGAGAAACASSWTRARRGRATSPCCCARRAMPPPMRPRSRARARRAEPGRPRVLPLPAGARPVRLPRAPAHPLRRPRPARRARLAARRRLQRRPARRCARPPSARSTGRSSWVSSRACPSATGR